MIIFKKIICIALVGIIVMSALAGCSDNGSADIGNAGGTDETKHDSIIENDAGSEAEIDSGSKDIGDDKDAVSNTADIREPNDFTIDHSGDGFFYYGDIAERSIQSVQPNGYNAALLTTYRSVKDISPCSPIVVIGKIVDVYYLDRINVYEPSFTLYDFEITEVLQGDFVAGDRVTVSQYGGYIRGESYVESQHGNPNYHDDSNVVVVEHYGSAPELDLSGEYVMFLDTSEFVDKTYASVGEWTGIYKINDDNTVSRFNKNDEFWTYGTLDELKTDVANNPFDTEAYEEGITPSKLRD